MLELFLQELIPERKIVSLTYAPQEHFNPWRRRKDVRVDVECTDADGSRFVVEMQIAEQKDFYERAVFISSFAVQQQLRKGRRGYNFPTVYFIGLMDFSLHKGSDEVAYRYTLRENRTGERMTDRLQYIFLELPNCRKALTDEASVMDNFCYALHNMHTLKERPPQLDKEIFRLLFESAEICNFAPRERIKYEYDMTTKRDILNYIDFAREDGEKKGMEKGMEKGAEQKAKEIARQMLAEKLSIDLISRVTGLDEELIRSLQDSN